MNEPHYPRGSIIGSLHGFEWSSEESAAYEAAIEAINGAIGAYSAVIAAEERKENPDQAVITAAETGQATCTRERENLNPQDHEQIARARARFTELAEQIRAGRL